LRLRHTEPYSEEAVPVDESKLPQFFYRYCPSGSQQLYASRFRGVDPTGPLPDSVDFALYRQEELDRFTVVWLADTQAQSAAELDFLRDDVIAELIGSEAAFGVTVGDIIYDDLSLLPRHNRLVSAIGIPWYNVPGNHDVNYLAPNDRHSLETFKRIYGPPYYSFDYGQVHFVVLDTVIYLGRDQGRDEPHPRGAGRYIGGVDQQQLRWLAADLAQVPASRPVVLAMHIPLRSSYDPDSLTINVDNREEVLATLAGHQRVTIIAGHMHSVEHY
jgi:3',5'-cyclic AMP phosphodiesterase CpdA